MVTFVGAVAASLFLSISPLSNLSIPQANPAPTLNLSSVRFIDCDNSYGSGFVIADGIIATAAHVTEDTNCKDKATGIPLEAYKVDKEHDFALMTGPLPYITPMKYSCKGYKKGATVSALGYSGFGGEMRFRLVDMKVGESGKVLKVQGSPWSGLTHIWGGYIVPGMSGGPHIDRETYEAVGLTNIGESTRDYWGNRYIYPQAYSYALKDTILCN